MVCVVCVCVFVRVRACACVYVRVRACACVYVCMCVGGCVCTWVLASVDLCMCVRLCAIFRHWYNTLSCYLEWNIRRRNTCFAIYSTVACGTHASIADLGHCTSAIIQTRWWFAFHCILCCKSDKLWQLIIWITRYVMLLFFLFYYYFITINNWAEISISGGIYMFRRNLYVQAESICSMGSRFTDTNLAKGKKYDDRCPK